VESVSLYTPQGVPSSAWRIAREPFADLSGVGAREKGGRWNSPGAAVIYLSADAALPVLEVLVHLDLSPDLIPEDYVLMKVDLTALATHPVDEWLEEGPLEVMNEDESRTFGDRWLAQARTPLLRVRSVIIPESFNLLLNPNHRLHLSKSDVAHRPFSFDPRLLELP
jgi:RES domain-containing protein